MEPTTLVRVSAPSVVLSTKMTIIASERPAPPTASSDRRTNSEQPTNLLSWFIKQHQELRGHKYVSCASSAVLIRKKSRVDAFFTEAGNPWSSTVSRCP